MSIMEMNRDRAARVRRKSVFSLPRLVMAGVAMLCLAAPLAAKPAIRDVDTLDSGLFVVGLAHEIRKNCPVIEPRITRAITFLRGLERQAYALGYTRDEIRRHLKSDAEKDRLRARAAKYMDARGLGQDTDGYCALGRSEIAQKTEIGALLRVTK